MKTGIFAMPLIALAGMLAGCTNTSRTAQQQPAEMHTIQSNYSQHDLERSGRANTGSALRQIDPDVQ